MKLKIGTLVKTNYGAYCLITKITRLYVFGVWLSTDTGYLDISPQPAWDDESDTKEIGKATPTETRYFLKSIFKCFDKGLVRTA